VLRFGYTLLMHLATPLILLRLWLRGRTESGYRNYIGERFGGRDQGGVSSSVPVDSIWIHAVSVGEVRAAVPLIAALRAQWPEAPVVLTCMTPTGRRTALDLFTSAITVCYLPYDLPWALSRFISRWHPMMLVIMETELWPNVLATCAKRRIPAFLANARLSEKSYRGYSRNTIVRALARDAFGRFHTVIAQSQADAQRLQSLGAARVVVTGNLKFDLALDLALIELGTSWRSAATTTATQQRRPILLLASTREHEEMALANAYQRVFHDDVSDASTDAGTAAKAARTRPLLVIVPRHPSRFDNLASRVAAAGLTLGRRSAGSALTAETDVWLGDSMGEMQAYYAMCDVAIIGGSFQPLGGQNLIEAAALGKPVIMGPSTFNFADAVRLALAAEAMISVTDSDAAMLAAAELFASPERLSRMGENALHFAQAHRGATARTVEIIQNALTEMKKP
jgi:3-deoxy-D-manno-octulosonic-acid transferase